jgi:hypothetical protein
MVVTGNNPCHPDTRIVKPRANEYRRYPIVAIHGDQTVDEFGQVGTLDDLITAMPKMPPTCFVTMGAADLLAKFNKFYSEWTPESWQFRVSNHDRDVCRPDGKKILTRVTVAVHYLGWKNGNYHRMIDPVTMTGRSFEHVFAGKQSKLFRLLSWGVRLRDFCGDNDLDIRPTHGGIASQLLQSPKFYPGDRRKVPAWLNERSREHMPGNHYVLTALTHEYDREYTATYLDQTRAHHFHAANSILPDANFLFAIGRSMDLGSIYRPDVPNNFYGLLCLDLRAPEASPYSWLPTGGGLLEKQFVFTNELPHVMDMGYSVVGLRAAWGSRKRDEGIPRYAQWAQEQLDAYENAGWLKPLLLSTYGILATKPRYSESVFRIAKTGIPTEIRTGKLTLPGMATIAPRKLEPKIANVIHRGMIEAATRSESVGLAQHLTATGHRVLSIYADAVIVQLGEHPLPPIPDPWRSKGTLTHLQFIDQQAFISGEMTKLPGVGRELLRHNRRSPAPSLPPSVAESMEMEELTNKFMGGN